MKKLLLKTMLLLCTLIVGGASPVWADEEVTFASSKDVGTGTSASGSNSVSKDGITISCTAGGFAISGGAHYRLASGSTTTISSTVGNIKSVVFNGPTGTGSNSISKFGSNTGWTLDSSKGTYTWSGDAASVSLKANSGQVRPTSIVVTYTPTASKKYTTLTLSPTSLDLSYGGSTGSLTATVTPEGESALASPTVTWSSSNTSVATVSSGVVSPVGEGSCTITASYAGDEDYNESSNTATVTVTDARTAVVSAISSICSQKTLYIGGEIAFAPSVTLADGLSASDVTYSYVSADPTTIQINGNGTYTVLKTGTNIDITVTATPIAAKFATHKPVSATFPHNGAYRYSKPVFTPTGVTEGNFSGSMTLEMANDGTPTVPIYYTTDGTEPAVDKSNCTLYESSLTLTSTTTVKARVIDDNGLYSTVTTATYTKVPANKDAITLAAEQTLSFTNFSGLGDYGTDKATYVLASDGDKYKFTSTNVGYYSSVMQIKNEDSAYTTLSPVTSTNGFKMTVTTTQNSVKVYVGETEKTAVNDVYYFSSGDAVTLKRSGGTTKVSNITFTGLKPSRSVTFPDGNQTITVDGSTITKTATVSPAGTATYSSDNTAVATVNATTGEVTAVKGGTAVITATVAADDDYEKSTGSYTVTVNKAATTLVFTNDEETVELVDGTATFTATATPADGSRTITYSTDDEITVNSSTGAVTYTATGDFTIKANATATDKYLAPSEASYTLHVVDSRVPIVDASKLTLGLTDDSDNPIALDGVLKDDTGTLAASYTTATGFSGTEVVTYTSSDDDVLLISDNEFAAMKGGTATVTVTITSGGNKMFSTVEKEFTVTVTNPSKTATEITVLDENTDPVVDGDVLNLTYGTPVDINVDISSGYEGTISKVLSNSNIVGLATEGTTVTITPNAVGSTTLTFSAAETANYEAAATIVLTINVAGLTGADTAPDGDAEDVYTNSLLSNSLPSGWTGDGTVWSAEKNYGVVATSGYTSGTYDLVTEDFDLTAYTDVTLSFQHTGNGQSGNSSSFTTPSSACKVYVQEGSDTPVQLSITYFAGNNWTYVSSGSIDLSAYGGKTIHFIFRYTPTSGNNGKWEIKNFNVTATPIPTATVTINANGYATYCSANPIDCSALTGCTAWRVSNIAANGTITFTKITEKIKGGQGILLFNKDADGVNTSSATITFADGSTVFTSSENKLVGTTAPTYVASESVYGLSGNKFVKNNAAGNIPAGKAYIDASSIPASVKSFTFVFEDTDGVREIRKVSREEVDQIFDLSGRRQQKMQRGINIVNGKKVVVK